MLFRSPLIYAMQQGSSAQAAVVKRAIEQGDLSLFPEVLKIIQHTGALEYTRQQAQREADAACAALGILSNSEYKKSLLQLAHFAATRQF